MIALHLGLVLLGNVVFNNFEKHCLGGGAW